MINRERPLEIRGKCDRPKPIRRSKSLLKPTILSISYDSTRAHHYRYVLRLFAQDRSCSPATPRVMSDEMAVEKMSELQGRIHLTLHQPSRRGCHRGTDATAEAYVGRDEWLRTACGGNFQRDQEGQHREEARFPDGSERGGGQTGRGSSPGI